MKKFSDILTITLFCGFIAVFALLFLFLPDKTFSETENRALAPKPTLTAENLFSGDFAAETNEYFADGFPCRDSFLKIKSSFELGLLKGENNGALYEKDQLAVRSFDAYGSKLKKAADSDWYYENTVKASLQNVNSLAEKLDVPVLTFIPPRTIDVCESDFGYKLPYGDSFYKLCEETLSEKANFINILPTLKEKHQSGEYVVYKTDHHYTSLGAYYSYLAIAEKLGIDEKFDISSAKTTVVEDFSGTTASRGSFPIYEKDFITLYGENDYKVIADGEEQDFFDMEKAASHDKYSVFLGGTHGVTEIFGGNNKKLLVVKDSFADSLAQFLIKDYDIIMLDLKTNPDVSAAAEKYKPDAVLIVYNAENVITSSALGNLK